MNLSEQEIEELAFEKARELYLAYLIICDKRRLHLDPSKHTFSEIDEMIRTTSTLSLGRFRVKLSDILLSSDGFFDRFDDAFADAVSDYESTVLKNWSSEPKYQALARRSAH